MALSTKVASSIRKSQHPLAIKRHTVKKRSCQRTKQSWAPFCPRPEQTQPLCRKPLLDRMSFGAIDPERTGK